MLNGSIIRKYAVLFRLSTVCALTLLIGGCNFISDPVSLMKAPQIAEDKETLRTTIISQIPEGATLIRSKEEDDTSMIRYVDLNGDGKRETVVFYETTDQSVLQGAIFENVSGVWQKTVTFEGDGKILESLKFQDITGDGKVDIIAGFSMGDEEIQNGLIVYSYTSNGLETVVERPYTQFVITDLNGDGQLDLTIVSLKKNETATITTYQYDDGFVELDKLSLDPFVNSYYNIVAGKVAKDIEGIVLDTSVGPTSAYSLIFVMKDNKLEQVLGQDKTFKDLPIASYDVDNDGIVEIGLLETPKGWEHIVFDEVPWFFSYYQWDGESGLTFVRQQYHDLKNRFYLNFFPSEWHGNITIDIKSNKEKYLKFIMADTGKTVAEIKFFTLQQWEKEQGDWDLLVRDNERVIGYKSYNSELELSKNRRTIESDVAPIERKENKSE